MGQLLIEGVQDYYQSFLDNILGAIHYDGVNVTGAWGWAICESTLFE